MQEPAWAAPFYQLWFLCHPILSSYQQIRLLCGFFLVAAHEKCFGRSSSLLGRFSMHGYLCVGEPVWESTRRKIMRHGYKWSYGKMARYRQYSYDFVESLSCQSGMWWAAARGWWNSMYVYVCVCVCVCVCSCAASVSAFAPSFTSFRPTKVMGVCVGVCVRMWHSHIHVIYIYR